MNKLLITIYLFSPLLFSMACKPVEKKKDSTIFKIDTSTYYLDSGQVSRFFEGHTAHHSINKLIGFYQKRKYAFAWMNASGMNEYAGNFMNVLHQEQRKLESDSPFYAIQLEDLYNTISNDNYVFTPKDSNAAALELLLTMQFFDYAKRNWGDVNDESLRKVGWYIDRKKINVAHYLDTVLNNDQHSSIETEPTNRQYGLLKTHLLEYYTIRKKGGWNAIHFEKTPKKGDTIENMVALKNELYLMGDMTTNNNSPIFDETVALGIKQYQQRNGLTEDGQLNEKTIRSLNIPIDERIQQILINMERSRWVPVAQKGDYLVVNIPEFKLHVYSGEALVWSCNVVVGNSNPLHNSVIFNDKMETIVFSPYWNVPKGILTKEVIPGILKNSHYLANHNMEVVTFEGHPVHSIINWKNFPYTVREKPGKKNSLGLVKFLFPNAYDIYLHDSPEKSLFDVSNRAFSHGCIRVQEPFKLAKYLLRNNPIYTDDKIKALMEGGKETFVSLTTKVPVFIVYFTSFVDRAGKLNFIEDIYGNDLKMKKLLFDN